MSEEKDAASSTTPPAKFSRYRTVRRQAEPPKVESPPRQENKDGPARSMSRYRRARVVSRPDQTTSLPVPLVPAVPRVHAQSATTSPSGAREGLRRVTGPIPSSHRQSSHRQQRTVENFAGAGRPIQGQPHETERERQRRQAKEALQREAEKQRLRKEREEQERLAQQRRAQEQAEQARLAEEENATRLAEQKRKDLERLEAELAAAVPDVPRVASPGKEKFGFFSRKRASTKVSPPNTAGSSSGNAPISKTRSNEPPQGSGEPQRGSNEPLRGIERGGGGIVPGIDAPISAVNAGERRVLIRCKQSSINLPINPETTPRDLIYSAANIMTQNIIPSTALLLESYTQLGLERRIRRYEHIRDIMNSWDRDTQNALLLQNSDSPNFDTDLDTSSVPRETPKDFTVYMYHSQKPGKWNKRFITLQSSGQICIAKKLNVKATDKDVINICHLSDFDIYNPTPQQLRKNLRPPKKHCYAIKSQQKTTMFLSTENFVHFFSTDDEALAEKWYSAVQRWRSWYLVNRMGEGKRSKGKTVKEVTAQPQARPGTKAGPSHKVKVSVDESPYTIGSFTPLINLDRFDASQDPNYDSEEESRPRQIPFHLRNSVSFPSQRESKRHPPPVSYRLPPEAEEEFASSGLLGRSYSQRQRMQKENQNAVQTGPFVDGPSFLNSGAPLAQAHQRTPSLKSTKTKRPATSAGPGAGGIQRSPSQKQKTKPLLDFTPQFKEAPQWDKTGKGHGVKPVEGVPLVEVATTRADPLADGTKQTFFRREGGRPATAGAGLGKDRDGAFVKGGLLSGDGYGGSIVNRGRAGS